MCACKMRVSLSELDHWFEYILAGKPYHGEAINPKNLSLFESLIGVGEVYLLLVMRLAWSPSWLNTC